MIRNKKRAKKNFSALRFVLVFDISEVNIKSYSKHLVGSCELVGAGRCDTVSCQFESLLLRFLEVVVCRPEVGNVELHVLCHLDAGTKSDGIAAGDKTHVAEVASIAQSVVCLLSADTHLYDIVDVVFHSRQIFLRVA